MTSQKKKWIKILLIVLGVICFLYLFLIAPRMFNKADLSAFEGVIFAHHGHFDEKIFRKIPLPLLRQPLKPDTELNWTFS